MIDVEKVRQRILDLAIRGKLVPQDPNDEPASVLLERIREEQIKLHREGKIKKLPEFSYIYRGSDNRYYEKTQVKAETEKNVPFRLPPSWCWVTLGSIFEIGSSKRVHKEDWRTEGIPFYRARDIEQLNKGGFKSGLYIEDSFYREIKRKYGVPKIGDLLITAVGTLGKVLVVRDNDPFYYKDGNIILLSNHYNMNPDFIKLLFLSKFMDAQIHDDSGSTTVDTFTIIHANQTLIPFPPKGEQEKILCLWKKINEILDLIEMKTVELSHLSASLKNKVLSAVFCSDKSYYSKKLSTVADIIMGQSVPSEKMHAHSQEGDLEFHQGKTCFSSCGLLFSGVFTAEYKKVSLPNSVLLSMRAPVGTVIINNRTIAVGRGLCSIRPTPSLDLYYLFWYLTLIEKELVKRATGTTFLAIGVEVVRNIEIPIPPIDHQRHIASLIERANYFLKAIAAV